MTVGTPNANLLLVEGIEDRSVLTELFEKATGIPWKELTRGNRR